MFKNVPAWLEEKILGLQAEIDSANRGTLYYAASGWTIACYLRKDIQATDVDSFFDPPGETPIDENDTLWHDHVNRAIQVAETIFMMRNTPGFKELRKRLERSRLRSAFFELLAAKQFLKAGFEVNVQPPTFSLGSDFDFSAHRGPEIINIEVTALEAIEFSERTILNALRRKRRQLPSGTPAIIYCVIPEPWTRTPRDWDAILESISARFLRGTRRINAIVFWAEQHQPLLNLDQPGAALSLVRKPYFNEKPACSTDLNFLVGGLSSEEFRRAIETTEGFKAIKAESYNSEFFRWIDHLVPPPGPA